MTRALRPVRHFLRRLAAARDGVIIIEYAFYLPILLLLGLSGAEITNYIITRMRISQLALHLADNAARIGTGTQLQQKTINEVDINDLLTGAGLQAGELDLFTRGRVIISSVENDPANAGKFRIRWQRCRGSKSYDSPYDNTKTNLAGVGPSGRQVIAPTDGATMWVEVSYTYRPLVKEAWSPSLDMVETASMMVRDRRALTPAATVDANGDGVLEVAGEAASTC
ncbi:tight adherence protein TadE [Sphingomonas spermidinifaciens]|uniref:Tight adherence protein TadE n=1 Tax=Sphingomonas spermidinifaciens TaxID=1141889 RepID=A0A2A4B0X3_9SPHN|nr:tight adherence protein TadE [Sphingomonas spermidinifaciens]PCD01605.1 tight adherence protein TadE [Sphingomonas spermidinifaciens]